MHVALYRDHHHLPGWHAPQNPYLLYSPELIEGWTVQYEGNRIPLCDHWMMAILEGLYCLDLPEVMAHVSCKLDVEGKRLLGFKRMWVQLTTVPAAWDDLPEIVADGKVLVNSLWFEHGPGVHNPYHLLKGDRDLKVAEFWQIFFLNKLLERRAAVRQEAPRIIEEAQEKIRRQQALLADYDRCVP